MKTDIWMPIYIGDYLSDTLGLTLAEHGAYLLSIMAYWRKRGPLTDSELQSICNNRCDNECNKVCDRVCQFYVKDGNLWRHKRIDIELELAKKRKLAQHQRTEAARVAKQEKWNGSILPVTRLVTMPVTDNVTRLVTTSSSSSSSSSQKTLQ